MVDAAAKMAALLPPVLVAERAPPVLAGTPSADTHITLISTPLQLVLLVYCNLSGRNPYGGTRGRTDATCHPWRHVHPVYKLKYTLPYQYRPVTFRGPPSGSSRLLTLDRSRSPTGVLMLQKVAEENEEMLNSGVIEPATSEWASPVELVQNKDGSLRFCVDYRRLNTKTLGDAYHLPRMDDCVYYLG